MLKSDAVSTRIAIGGEYMFQQGRLLESVDLDFKGYRGTAVHPYPATMPYPLAEHLLLQLSKPGAVVADPFMGSGTTLRAAVANGREVVGTDLNPLACLISRVSLQPYSIGFDHLSYQLISQAIWEKLDDSELWPKQEWAGRVGHWFADETSSGLAQLTNAIVRADLDPDELDFALLVLSRTVRRTSMARPGELKLWKRADPGIPKDPRTVFFAEALQLGSLLATSAEQRPANEASKALVVNGDAARLGDYVGSVDLVLTSPPYGDAWTTVAYGNFSLLSRIWLGAADESYVETDPTREDARSLGGSSRARPERGAVDVLGYSSVLREIHQAVYSNSEARASELLLFFEDMYPVFQGVTNLMAESGTIAIVMGPRTVSGIPVDSGLILVDFLKSFDWEYAGRNYRKISGKRLPTKTEQGIGGVSATINTETIDVFMRG